MSEQTIQDGMVVSLAYELRLEAGGEVIDDSTEGPIEYLQGAGEIIPGLELALVGSKVGDRNNVVISPSNAYGEYDEEAIESYPLEMFPEDAELQEGMVIAMRDQDGNVFEAQIVDMDDDEVTLDFNHPLAGETLYFSVRVVDVREATEEEKKHGHAHGAHAHDH